ncbi:mucin-associated surface protein (MASP), putative, partial [Trypanosoma cruzi]
LLLNCCLFTSFCFVVFFLLNYCGVLWFAFFFGAFIGLMFLMKCMLLPLVFFTAWLCDLSLLLLSLRVDGALVCAEGYTQVKGVMAMMTGRVLLVCALCVLWCGTPGGRCDVANDVVDGGVKQGPLGGSQSDSREEEAGKPELSESVDEGLGSADHSLDTRSGTNVSEQGNLVNEPPTENVGKEGVEGEALGTQRNEVHEQQVEEEVKEL